MKFEVSQQESPLHINDDEGQPEGALRYKVPLKGGVDEDDEEDPHWKPAGMGRYGEEGYLPGSPSTSSDDQQQTLSDHRRHSHGEKRKGLIKRRSSLAGTPGMLRTDGPWWADSAGRTLMLRGVNVSGSCKLPYTPRMPSHIRDGFFDDVNVSFVGRPFPLAEADEHFGRLRRWGFNFLRFNVAWEALEHAGPGIYDYEYMEYVVKILLKAKQYGFRVFIDPHQDVWSRFSGGSGAPGWTLRLAGLDVTKFNDSFAAIVHNTYHDPANYPKMIWPTNYFKLACATMFTLFFGGSTFAPNLVVSNDDGTTVNIQEYLQEHYCDAFVELAKVIKRTPGLEDEVVIGYDTLNEPSGGWIGVHDLSVLLPEQDLKIGNTPTPFQTMKMGMGISCDVDVYELTWAGPQKKERTTLQPTGTAWLAATETKPDCSKFYPCIWAQHGVWDPETQTLLKKDYFAKHPITGEPVDFLADYWRVFVHRVTKKIRSVHETAVIFVEPPVNEHPPVWDPERGDPTWRIAYAPHWYDGMTLINKHFNRWFSVDYIGYKRGKYLGIPFAIKIGEYGIREAFKSQIEMLRRDGFTFLGQHPCIMGEIGIPYDMDDRDAYKTGDYSAQERAMDTNIRALEANLINFTLWNYCSDNCHEWGDGWNGEDLSLFSRIPSSVVSPPSPDIVETTSPTTPASFLLKPLNDDSMDRLSNDSRNPIIAGAAPPPKSPPPIVESEMLAPPVADAGHSRTITGASSVGDKPLMEDTSALDIGGRALHAFARPYAVLTPGTPMYLNFDMASSLFTFSFSHPPITPPEHRTLGPRISTASLPVSITKDPSNSHKLKSLAKFLPRNRRFSTLDHQTHIEDLLELSANDETPTTSVFTPDTVATEVEIYVPRIHYPSPDDVEVWVSEGHVRLDLEDQRLHWRCGCFDAAASSPSTSPDAHRLSSSSLRRKHKDQIVEHTIVMRRKKVGQAPLIDIGRRRRLEVKAEREGDIEKIRNGIEPGTQTCGGCSVM